jgi:O-antigen ligase/Flp pilus assembly protein TadD
VSDWLLRAHCFVISGAVFATGVLFLPSLADPVNIVKLTVLVLAALVTLVLTAARLLRGRALAVPRSASAYAAAAFALALVASAAAAPSTSRAIFGTYGRNSGLLAYAAALILFFVGMRAWRAGSGQILMIGIIASGAFTATYGLLQYVGVDAIHWNNPFNPIIASLGNPDFASAYLGMCSPAAAWAALSSRWSAAWRLLCGVVLLMSLVGAILSKAVQGPLAACAGLAVLAVAILLERGGTAAKRGVLALGAAAVLTIVALGAGVAKLGPAAAIFRRYSFRARQFYWDAALSMFKQHPLTGVGLEHYGTYWRQVRSDAATRLLGGTSYSDAAHSVPLQMLAQGGLLLGASYVLFVLTVAIALWHGLRRLEGPARLLLGGIGGVWAAYVVSAAVSIDQVPMLTMQFAAAGCVVGLAGVEWHQTRLPGAMPVVPAEVRRRGRQTVPRGRAFSGQDLTAVCAVAAIACAAAWFACVPFRASAAAHRGDLALARGDGTSALSNFQRANRIFPGEGIYWEKTASLLETAKLPSLALKAYAAGAQNDRSDVALLLNEGRLAQSQGALGLAEHAYLAALRLDPTNPATVELAAAFEAGQGQASKAVAALERASRANPKDADLQVALGAANRKAGDIPAARAAYSRALEIQPGLPVASEGLNSLG